MRASFSALETHTGSEPSVRRRRLKPRAAFALTCAMVRRRVGRAVADKTVQARTRAVVGVWNLITTQHRCKRGLRVISICPTDFICAPRVNWAEESVLTSYALRINQLNHAGYGYRHVARLGWSSTQSTRGDICCQDNTKPSSHMSCCRELWPGGEEAASNSPILHDSAVRESVLSLWLTGVHMIKVGLGI